MVRRGFLATVTIVEELVILEKKAETKIETAHMCLILLPLWDLDDLGYVPDVKKEIIGPLNADRLLIRIALSFRKMGGGTSPSPRAYMI